MERINKLLIFLYPIFFGLPDMTINIGVINLRIDDIIVYVLLILNLNLLVKWKFLIDYNPFYKIIRVLIFWYLFTMLKAFLVGYEISTYELIKSVGSLPYLIIIPVLLLNKEYRIFFFKGAAIGVIIFVYGIYTNYRVNNIDFSSLERSSDLKASLSFLSLNPNAVSLISVIFSFILLTGYHFTKKKYFLILGLIGLIIPFFTFSRGMSVGILVSIFIFVILRKTKKIKALIVMMLLFLLAFNLLNINNPLINSATKININSGEGFSNRYILWSQGLELIEKNPLTGSGFATIEYMYETYFNGHIAHNILIHYAVELGIIGLTLFLVMIVKMLRNKFRWYKSTRNEFYLMQFSLLLGIIIYDMSSQDLYFNKYGLMIFIFASLKYEHDYNKNTLNQKK